MISQKATYSLTQGTYQDDRLLESLNPSYVKLDDRSLDDLVEQLYEHASHLHFFENDPDEVKGDWRAFFSDIINPSTQEPDMKRLEALEKDSALPPHLALAVTFLRLFAYEQEAMNGLTAKHLDFYYEDLLKFKRREGTVGNVPVFAELARNVDAVTIPQGARFSAGKDKEGKEIIFAAAADYILGKAEVEAMNSSNANEKGFYLAITSPMLSVKENDIRVKLAYASTLVGVPVQYTMKDGWSPETLFDDKEVKLVDYAPFDSKVHGTDLGTKYPVIRFAFASAKDLDDKVAKQNPFIRIGSRSGSSTVLARPLTSIKSVSVPNGTKISLCGKLGPMENKVGLQPFGPMPSAKDFFTVTAPEIQGCSTTIGVSSVFNSKRRYSQTAKDNKLTISVLSDCGYSNYLKSLVIATRKLSEGTSDGVTIPTKPSVPALENPITVPYVIYDNNSETVNTRFLVTPMGYSAVNSISSISNEHLTDRNVYIGLSGVKPGTSISLFVKLASDRFVDDADISTADAPEWSILEGDVWKKADKVLDTTNDLTEDGFVKIAIGSKSGFMKPHTILAAEYTWLRIRYAAGKECYPSIESVSAQAIELIYDPTSPGKPESGTSLPKDSISKPLYAIAGLKKVNQPFGGFPGSADESEQQFRIRVSERLRHKGRSVSTHDYERIVLQAFPDIAAVKCIPSACGVTGGPGIVNIVLVPKAVGYFDRCPGLKAGTLRSVQDLLKKTSSPFAEIKVQNPTYEMVGVNCTITLRPGFADESAQVDDMKKRLTAFIAPWSDGAHAVSLTNNLNESKMLHFIESLPYVDTVSNLEISVTSGTATRIVEEGEDILPQEKYAVLTAGENIDIRVSKE